MPSRQSKLRKRFYEALGKFTATWASMESALDVLTIVAMRYAKNQRQPSHQLEAKLTFIRGHMLPSIPMEHAADLAAVLDRIDALSEDRHELIHGAGLLEVQEGKLLVVTFGRLLQPKNKVRRKPSKVTTEKIEAITSKVDDIWANLLDFAEDAMKGRFLS
jgi:hypothetical protein